MPNVLLTVLFWSAALAVVLGQVFILRSTARAWQRAAAPVPASERIFAWLPAVALALVLVLSWRAATRPPIIEVQFDPATQGIKL